MTLTQAASFTKLVILITALTLFMGISLGVGYQIWFRYNKPKVVLSEQPPEERFGKLSNIAFPPSKVSSSNFAYTLDTNTGGLPEIPKMIKVYFIPQAAITLLAPERSKELAGKLGFTAEPEILSPTKYKFANPGSGTLILELTTGNFLLQKAEAEKKATQSASLNGNQMLDQTQIVSIFKEYLKDKGLLPQEINNGRSKVFYDSPTQLESSAAEVDVWPEDFDGLPLVTFNLNRSLLRAIVTKYDDERRFAQINYTFWPIDKTTFSTYPLKTADEALADLKSGRGFISAEPKNPQVSITSVYLAYFQTEDYSPYLQPVFVFEGSNFAALVPAIL